MAQEYYTAVAGIETARSWRQNFTAAKRNRRQIPQLYLSCWIMKVILKLLRVSFGLSGNINIVSQGSPPPGAEKSAIHKNDFAGRGKELTVEKLWCYQGIHWQGVYLSAVISIEFISCRFAFSPEEQKSTV